MSRAPVAGSTLVASQRCVRANTDSRAGADRNLLVEPAELGPGLQPVEVEIGAKAQRIDRPPHVRSSSRTLARLTMCTHLAATSEKLWPGGVHDLGRPAQLRLHVGGDELLDQLAAERRRRAGRAPPACRRARWSASRWHRRTGRSVASRSSRISIRKLILGRCRGAPDRTGPARSRWHRRGRRAGLPGRQRDLLQRLRRQALDGIAIQRADARTSRSVGHRLSLHDLRRLDADHGSFWRAREPPYICLRELLAADAASRVRGRPRL